MKKIAFFMHNFNGGGAEKVTIKTAEELSKRGYEVSIIVRENIGELKDNIDSNIKVIDLKINNKSKIVKNFKNIKNLSCVIKNNKYDVIFGVTFNMSVLLAIANMLKNSETRIFAIMHNTISCERHKYMKLRKWIMNIVSKKFEKIIFVSEGARVDYLKIMKIIENKTITIYNPVVTNEITEKANLSTQCDWIENKGDYKIIINIGRLTEQKNQKMLLEAIKIVGQNEKIRLIILGEGELRKNLEEKAQEENITDLVKFYGFTKNPFAFLSKADLFVLSSDYEGLPTVLIEALACGCNIVSTDCPTGPNEILDGGKYGRLSKVNDAKNMAKSICEMLKSGGMQPELLKKRAELFSVDVAINKYIELIEK